MALASPMLLLAGCGGSAVQIDYVDFVQLGGITYVASSEPASAHQIEDGDLGTVYGQVRTKLERSQDPNHQIQDGDSAFLSPGTQVYRVNGYRPTFRLAARHDGRLVLYEADTNPAAKVGADLLDLAGKVAYIGINSPIDGTTPLGTVKDPAVVQTTVDLVERGAVDQSAQTDGQTRYFIDFHLVDGTEVIRAYWPETGLLARGIRVPDAFRSIVESAVSGVSTPNA
jgi:hypothetical protein